jgi:Tol biopolymer transport system component
MPFNNFPRLFYLAAFLLFPILMFGQYYNLGQDPASLKWRIIRTPHFRIIYPENFEQKAQKMMPTLDYINSRGNKTLAFNPKQVPLIIHNYTIVPNAVTVWAPKRIELFSCPPQDSYAQDWMDQLIIHEYRHVVQIDRTNQGFTRVLSWLTGEQAATMINGLFVPSWFMEGDAVCTETALSHSGRGRIPNAEMLLRAQVTEKGAYSYDKAALGSYTTFVPNQYALGYQLVANVRRKYGYQAWVTALDEVARKPFLITPFNHGLKKATGFGKEKLYSLTMLEMDSMWKYQDTKTLKTDFKQLTQIGRKKYENYKYPNYINDSVVIAEYTSLDDIARFVITGPDGYRQIITTPGFLSSEPFTVAKVSPIITKASKSNSDESTNNYLVAWTETINDLRWEQRNYSVIRIYDSRTHQTRSLTLKSRYFAPSFSPDGRTIAAVFVDPTNHNSIVLIDVESGKDTATIIASDSDFYMTPSWSEDGTKIVFIKLDGKGKSINVYELKTQAIKTLIPSTYTEIANPVFAHDYVLFNGSFSGIENIYAVDLKGNEVFQVTSAAYGASNADLSPDGGKIVYSNYSSSGYHLVETTFIPASWKRLSEIRDFSPSLYKYLVKEEASVSDSTADRSLAYNSEPYKKIAHIFNFHSWAPAYINYMAGENGTGISFMSQNELSTATTVIGYKYDMAENTGKFTADFNWQAWYPVIDLSASYGARAAYTGGDTSFRYNFNETVLSGGFTLPLIFTGGKYYKGLRLQLHTSLTNITENTSPLPAKDKLTGTIHSLDYSFSAYRFIKQSGKDIYPRWGQVITGSYRHTPFGKNDYGSIASAGVRLYFPGLLIHHGIRIDMNWQNRNFTHYYYPNQIVQPRGYFLVSEKTLTCFALNYKFPIAYPDFALGPLVYLKRLKANLFYDGGIESTHGVSQQLQSTGVEITSDMHFLRFIFPLDIGFRFGYRPIEKQYFTDLLFSVNLSN